MRLKSKASQKKLRRQGSVLHRTDSERSSNGDIGSVDTKSASHANDKLSPTSSIAAMSSSEGFDR